MTTRGTGLATSLEAGWRLQPVAGLSVEPQVQYVWQGITLDESKDGAGNSFNTSENSLHKVRAGVRVGNVASDEGLTKRVPVSCWVKPSVTETFGSTGRVSTGVSGLSGTEVSFSPRQNGTVGVIEAGLDAGLGRGTTVGVRAGYIESLNGAAAEGYYGQLNVNVSF